MPATLALAQNSALKGQLQLHEKAAAAREASNNMTAAQASKNSAPLFSGAKDSQTKNPGPVESTPERFDI